MEEPPVDGVKLTIPLLTKPKFEVENMLEQGEVVCTKLGRATDNCHTINTGMSQPLRTCPYRLAPAWKDQLREEVHTLVEAGTLKLFLSPWSCPMVQVRKPDGSVRLCIDFRRINKVTQPDPYTMPRVDEMIVQLGKARY